MLSNNISPHTVDGALPESFVQQDWSVYPTRAFLPACMTMAGQKCDAWRVDFPGNGASALMIVYANQLYAFQADQSGAWQLAATWALRCTAEIDAVRAGQFKAVLPVSPLPDLEIAGQRFPASPPAYQGTCR